MQVLARYPVEFPLFLLSMANPTTSKCHPCRAKGMEQINYFITPERKSKFKKYCQMRGVSMTSMLNSLAAKELELHYDRAVVLAGRKKLHSRAKAYRYLRMRSELR